MDSETRARTTTAAGESGLFTNGPPTLIPHVVLFVASFALMTIWFVWTALITHSEAGPAFVRRGMETSKARERHAA